jgi:hypothetical protein
MARENSLQASPARNRVKQELTPARSEEKPDTQTPLPPGGGQTRDGKHADDRSGSD